MTEPAVYPTWRAIEQALKAKAASNPVRPVGDQLTQAVFDRFLSRVFADHTDTSWLLKGGTGILARIPDGRRTQDVDLASTGNTLDDAVEDLRQRAATDLGDHLRFTLSKQVDTGQGATQPAVQTRRVTLKPGTAPTRSDR